MPSHGVTNTGRVLRASTGRREEIEMVFSPSDQIFKRIQPRSGATVACMHSHAENNLINKRNPFKQGNLFYLFYKWVGCK